MGLISNAIQNANQREALAAQLVTYFQQHQSEIKSGVDSSFGGFMINTSDIYGEDLNKDALASIFKYLQHDSDGDAIIETRNYQFGVQYGYGYISVPGYNEVGGASYSQTETGTYGGFSGSTSNNDAEETWSAFDAQEEKQEQQKNEELNLAREQEKEIDNLPIPTAEEIVYKIKECRQRAERTSYDSKKANNIVRTAWQQREKMLYEYAKDHYATNDSVASFFKKEAEKAEKKAAEAKAKAALEKEKQQKKKEEAAAKKAAEELKIKRQSKTNKILWLSWLALSIFFLSMGEVFWYEWYHYVLVVLAIIVVAFGLIVKYMLFDDK